MENEETIKTLTWLKQYVTTNEVESLGKAIEALEKADKYRWHDLRKNPDDLPKLGETVIIVCKSRFTGCEYNSAKLSLSIQDGYEFGNGAFYFSDVVAWKEIEPFKE